MEIAARVYEALLVDHPAVLEAHLRLARLELRLGRPEQAEAHLVRVAGLEPDARQAYLAALFLADVYERQGRIADAIAAYGVAQQNWPRRADARHRPRPPAGAVGGTPGGAGRTGRPAPRTRGGRPGAIRSLDGIHRRPGLAPARRASPRCRRPSRPSRDPRAARRCRSPSPSPRRRSSAPASTSCASKRWSWTRAGRSRARRGRLHGHRQRRAADDRRPRPRPPADRRRDRPRREQQRPRRTARAPRARRPARSSAC